MKNNDEKKKKRIIIIVVVTVLVIVFALVLGGVFIFQKQNTSYASVAKSDQIQSTKSTKISPQATIDSAKRPPIAIEEITQNNSNELTTQVIEEEEIDLEFTTQYKNNNQLAKGKIQVLQEGVDGKQTVIVKKIYKNGELVGEEQLSSQVTKSSVDKIVQIGTASYSTTYIPKKGDMLTVTSTTLVIRIEPNEEAEKIVTINKGEEVKLESKEGDWYYVIYNNTSGWAKTDCLTYNNPNADGEVATPQYTKEQLMASVKSGTGMRLDGPSGLTIEQFKKVLESDSNDKNKVFAENAEYFYYIEKQYNINGIFVAAVGIHESGWGTSSISKNKKNLFGYGAYDSSPGESAYSFTTYAEGIDLIARVFCKYYLYPKGTAIYGGEIAKGSYYNGPTLQGINTRYATDKNWANSVNKWMTYLYNKL